MHEPYNYLRWLFSELPKLDGDDVVGFKPCSVEQRVNLQEEPVALTHIKYEQ